MAKYALPAITEETPDQVEGEAHWVRSRVETDAPCTAVIKMVYWDGATEVGRTLIYVNKSKVLTNGGTYTEWQTFRALAAADDTDDVVQHMVGVEWAKKMLWGCWHSIQGQ